MAHTAATNSSNSAAQTANVGSQSGGSQSGISCGGISGGKMSFEESAIFFASRAYISHIKQNLSSYFLKTTLEKVISNSVLSLAFECWKKYNPRYSRFKIVQNTWGPQIVQILCSQGILLL